MARIIYVEDDQIVAELVQEILSEAGHIVGVIAHGELGHDTIYLKQPDLVILDRDLPGMEGVAILRSLKSFAGLYRTPILMLSANRSQASIDEAMAAGASDYVVKPFDRAELVERVDACLRETEPVFRRPRGSARN
jgi:two-component system, OmpR family, response regulator MtrA